ncbi:MAG: 2-nitropropane dioxygenase [Acidobacteriota bacterium]|nr:MAG: 2-nitropropane dioxygenase [Acidobacteriota bacterium]
MSKDRVNVVCPCCQASLVLDRKTGLVIHSEKKKLDYSLDDALKEEESRRKKSDELFAKAFEDEKARQQNLEAKFQEALDSKDELDEPVRRPWDFE